MSGVLKFKDYFFRKFNKVVVLLTRFFSSNQTSELLQFDFSPINSGKQLSLTLQNIASTALKEIKAVGVEICLYDKESGRYHQSIVVGKPFRDPIDEALKDINQKQIQNCIIEVIHFAGVMVGAVRCQLKSSPTADIKSYLKVLVQQVNLAVVNFNFVEQMAVAQKSAQDSQRARTGFLASLSHELRGPLGIILNASEIVKDELAGPVNQQQKDMLSMVLKSGEHLLELLNDVLDYARIESGKVAPQLTKLDLPAALQELITVVRVQAQSKKQKIKIITDISCSLECDRKHFRQIIINLLTNAIKYTPDEGVINVSIEQLIGGKVKISVADTGCGISQEDREKVFSPFERIQKGYAATQSGTGLGLSLTQKLVQVNNGFIDYESVLGKGTTFFVTFNEVKDSKHIDENLIRPKESKFDLDAKGQEIIFVGSDSDEVKIIVDYLKNKNFVVHKLNNTQLVPSETYQNVKVIILDDSIAQLYGANEAASIVRRSLSIYSIPLVLLTTKAFEFEVSEMLRNGVDRLISKPCTLESLSKDLIEIVLATNEPVTKILH
jgi:signal transduction histidine kinase/CheY-like chemotaxis protein